MAQSGQLEISNCRIVNSQTESVVDRLNAFVTEREIFQKSIALLRNSNADSLTSKICAEITETNGDFNIIVSGMPTFYVSKDLVKKAKSRLVTKQKHRMFLV